MDANSEIVVLNKEILDIEAKLAKLEALGRELLPDEDKKQKQLDRALEHKRQLLVIAKGKELELLRTPTIQNYYFYDSAKKQIRCYANDIAAALVAYFGIPIPSNWSSTPDYKHTILDVYDVRNRYEKSGFRLANVFTSDEWTCLLALNEYGNETMHEGLDVIDGKKLLHITDHLVGWLNRESTKAEVRTSISPKKNAAANSSVFDVDVKSKCSAIWQKLFSLQIMTVELSVKVDADYVAHSIAK